MYLQIKYLQIKYYIIQIRDFSMPDIESGHCNMYYKYDDLFPLIKKKFYNFDINCPKNYDKILTNCIGKDYLETIIIKKNNKVYKVSN